MYGRSPTRIPQAVPEEERRGGGAAGGAGEGGQRKKPGFSGRPVEILR